MDRIRLKKVVHFMNECTPIRLKGFHYFCGRDQSILSMALPAYKFLFGKQLRLRFHVHTATGETLKATIKEFGIDVEKLSYLLGGNYTQQDFLKWLDERRKMEKQLCQ